MGFDEAEAVDKNKKSSSVVSRANLLGACLLGDLVVEFSSCMIQSSLANRLNHTKVCGGSSQKRSRKKGKLRGQVI